METLKAIPAAVAALIPADQLKITKRNLREFTEAIKRLETALNKCPKLGETDGMKEHPLMFHYFTGGNDIFICEYDRDDLMYGYGILNGDLPNSEWGYFSVSALTKVRHYNIEYFSDDKSIEAALHTAYPNYFKKPPSMGNWLDDGQQVINYMVDVWDLYEGEGLEEAFKKWEALPKEQRTETELEHICKTTGQIDFDQNDPPEWLPKV
jgi:hypothetical protein